MCYIAFFTSLMDVVLHIVYIEFEKAENYFIEKSNNAEGFFKAEQIADNCITTILSLCGDLNTR